MKHDPVIWRGSYNTCRTGWQSISWVCKNCDAFFNAIVNGKPINDKIINELLK
jgi:hypothetical protein